jgi:hypothetical protein
MRVPVARIQRQAGPSAFRCTAPGNALEHLKLPCSAWFYFPKIAEQPLAPLAEGFVPSELHEGRLLSMEHNKHNTTLVLEYPSEIPSGTWVYVEDGDFAAGTGIYFYQIRGLKVIDESGAERGRILDYMETGASGILLLGIGEREVYVPVVDKYVEFNMKEGHVLVKTLEDFL